MLDTALLGYFTSSDQTAPAYDPGLDVPCPLCGRMLARPVKTVSLMWEQEPVRSYFYRVHGACLVAQTEAEVAELDERMLDAAALLGDIG